MKRLQFALAVVLASIGALAVPSISAAASSGKVTVQMTLKDLSSPGAFDVNDDLRLTVVTDVGGKPAKHGEVNLVTNDPKERELCGIIQPVGKHGDYCNIDFPNAGRFTISAEYEPVYVLPGHYTVVRRLAVTIKAPRESTSPSTVPQQSETVTPTFSVDAVAETDEAETGEFSVSAILNTGGLLTPNCPAPALGVLTASYPASGSLSVVYPFACSGPGAAYGTVFDADASDGGTTIELSYSGATYKVLGETITLRPATTSLYLP